MFSLALQFSFLLSKDWSLVVFVPRFAEFYVIDIDDYQFACALLEIPLTGTLLCMHSYLLCT